jgi:hypothetical protein
MKKSLLVASLLVLLSLMGGCSGGADETTTSSTDLPDTSTSLETTSTTATTLPAGVFEIIRHQETEGRLTYAGTWKASDSDSASGKSFAFAGSSGASLTIRFVGTQLSWIAKKSPAYGKAEVTVDGSSVGSVDLYSADEVWQQVVWQTDTLSVGPHAVTIAWTGEKTAAATGTNINIDAIEVNGVLTGRYQQTNNKLVYAGDWKATSDASASGDSFAFVNAAGASVTIRFNGVHLVWLAKKSSSYGKAQVTVDGGSPVTVDLYSADVLWRQEVWNSGVLGSGSHTVVIQWTGSKNAAATDTNINIDYLYVAGTLE